MTTTMVNTILGQVSVTDSGWVHLDASEQETSLWARRWPCSKLSKHHVTACFAHNGDLVDMEGPEDVDAAEFNAWAADCAAVAMYRMGAAEQAVLRRVLEAVDPEPTMGNPNKGGDE